MNPIAPFIESVLTDVCELPDRTSPEDQPDMLLVTGEELAAILECRLEHLGFSAAALDVVAERVRQVQVEGWTTAHDDAHGRGELSRASAAYAYASGLAPNVFMHGPGYPPSWWPWAAAWWKPRDKRRNLVRAAALAIAEIERLDRADVG